MHALDGLRAVAILWVYILHSIMLFANNQWEPAIIAKVPFMCFIRNGDIGVDIFFVLSGFLISFILLKEADKYGGKIDIFNFYRSRAIRLWFTMLPFSILSVPSFGPKYGLPSLLFVGNMIYGSTTHLWSISVEFQFYLISPLIVYWMNKGGNNPWYAAATI